MCNFFQESASSKYWEKRFGYSYPYPVPFESSFWIFVSDCKLPILLDTQSANHIAIIFDKWRTVLEASKAKNQFQDCCQCSPRVRSVSASKFYNLKISGLVSWRN